MEEKIEEIRELLKEAEELDYGPVVRQLAGKMLDGKGRECIERFNSQYDRAKEMKEQSGKPCFS